MTRVLTTAELNRTVLARQMLLERSALPLHRVVERMAGVQAQYAPSAYIGLWSRVAGFQRDHLTSALERRSIIQATVMRGTIHLVSRADYWPLTEASRAPRQDNWIRAWARDVDIDEIVRLAGDVKDLLSDGPVKRREIVETLSLTPEIWNGVVNWVDLVRVPPSGTWESRRADLYGLASWWVGQSGSHPEPGRKVLVRRYLAGFGPATRRDISAFTMLSLNQVDQTLGRMPTRRFTTEAGDELWDVPGAPIVEGDRDAPIRFLGQWDAILLTHCRRADVLPEEHRTRIFHTKAPQSFATYLVDGRVRGTWRVEDGLVVVDEFEPIPRRFESELADEKDQLAAFFR